MVYITMQYVKGLFWNGDQRRGRALWRLVGQLIMLIVVALPLQAGVGFAAFGMLMSRKGLTPGQLRDPQAVQRFITETPMLMTLSTLALLAAFPISVWLAGRFLDRRPFVDFGFHIDRDWWIDLGFGLLLGAALMLMIFLIELAAGWVTVSGTFATRDPDVAFTLAILPPLLTFLAVGFYEELFSRGYQLRNISEGLNWEAIGPGGAIAIATLISSAIFGVLHVGNPNASLISTLYLCGAGIQLALGFLLTGELAIPIGLHVTWNFFQGNVFGFPVSGGDYGSATFIAIEQGGPDVWTGGAFGPEAGLVGLLAMVVGALLIVLWVRRRYGRAKLHVELAEAPERLGESD